MNDKYFKKYHKYKMKYIIQKGGDLENMIDYLICPITKDIMIDPVVASDGHAYDKKAIIEWLKVNNTSPVTRQVLENDTLIPNINLKQMSENLLEFITIKNDSSPELKKQQEKLIQKINALRDFEMTSIRKFDLLLKENPQEILAEAFKYISNGNDSKLMSDELKWNKTTEWLGTRESSMYRIYPKNELKEILNQIIPRRSDEYPHGRVGPDLFNNSTYFQIGTHIEEPEIERYIKTTDRTDKYISYDISFLIVDNTFDGKPSKPWLNFVYGFSNSYSSSEGLPQVVLKGLLYLIKNTGSSISLDIKYNSNSDKQDTEINKLGIVSSKLWGLVPGV
jgi:hypothetical protein